MKAEELTTVNLQINGTFVPLMVPKNMESLYRTAEMLLEERAIQIKKEYAFHNLPDAYVSVLLAMEAEVSNLQLKKDNENFQQQIDTYLEMIGQSAA